jgi:hypothetical protein
MPPELLGPVRRWLAATQSAWPVLLIGLLAAFFLGYHFAPRTLEPLTPPFAFTSGTSTIEASGTWHSPGYPLTNATSIFCWFPVNSCQVTVADLLPDGGRSRLQLTEHSLEIVELSDASLMATASSTDPCHVESLRLNRKARTATLAVGPSETASCPGIMTKTATLGS